MNNFRNSLAAFAAAALTLSTPALAQAPSFRAVPVTPMTQVANVITGDTLWNCGPNGCTTARATARPAIVCEMAAKKVGKLASFTADTVTFDEAALAKCNAKAKA